MRAVDRADPRLRQLAIARVALGALFLLRTTPLLGPFGLRFLFDASPLLGWPRAGWHVAAFGFALPASAVAALSVVRTLAATSFLAGVGTRPAGILAAVTGWVVLAQDALGFINTLHLLYLGTLVLALGDCGSALAVRPSAPRSPGSSVVLVRLVIASVYAWSGIAKLNADWLRGAALVSLAGDGRLRGPLASLFVATPALCSVAAWLAVGFEVSIGPLLLARRTRRVALILALAFHALLELTVQPDFFGFEMAALLVVFWEPRAELRGSRSPSPPRRARR